MVYIADCVVHDMHIYKCFSLHMFFRAFKNEITELPEPLIDSLKFVPKLLTESKSSGTINNYFIMDFYGGKSGHTPKVLKKTTFYPLRIYT